MTKKETPIKQNTNFLIIILSSVIILGLFCFYLSQSNKDETVVKNESTIEGRFCGGIAPDLPQNQCPKGFYCKQEGKYPDAGGTCVKKWGI